MDLLKLIVLTDIEFTYIYVGNRQWCNYGGATGAPTQGPVCRQALKKHPR